MQTQGQRGKKHKVKAGKILKSKTIAKVVRNTRKKGKKQLQPELAMILKASEEDVLKLLAAQVHVGRKSAHVNMKRYIWKRRNDGIHILNLEKTWAKLVLAARIIVTVKDPEEIMVISSRTYGQRGAIKFAKHTGATPHASKWVPGTLTNPQNKAFAEPRLLIVDDPMTTFAALRETSYIGIPVIAFCNSDNNTRFVDCAIPCNNKGRYSIGLMFWFLAREVLRMRGQLARSADWFKENKEACPDLFFYRDPNEIDKAKKDREARERQAAEEAARASQDVGAYGMGGYDAGFGGDGGYGAAQTGGMTGLVDDMTGAYGGGMGQAQAAAVGQQATGGYDLDQSWDVQPQMQALDDWGDNTGLAQPVAVAQQYDMGGGDQYAQDYGGQQPQQQQQGGGDDQYGQQQAAQPQPQQYQQYGGAGGGQQQQQGGTGAFQDW